MVEPQPVPVSYMVEPQRVPSVPSVACSTAEALAWDASFQGQNDPSGRAVRDVHEHAVDPS